MNSTIESLIEKQLLAFRPTTQIQLEECENIQNYLIEKLKQRKSIKLNFICTHNSRRSQMAQIWAQIAADYFRIPIESYSGGVEITAFNERAVASFRRLGIEVLRESEGENPIYKVKRNQGKQISLFSKLYDDPVNPKEGFSAIMTCDHADMNCPYIPGAEIRLPLRFEDPKTFDNTSQEGQMYDHRSMEIAGVLFFIFKNLSHEFKGIIG